MKRLFVKKSIFMLVFASMATATASADMPAGTVTRETEESITYDSRDKTVLYGKATHTKTTTYHDASGAVLGKDTLTANRFSVELKSLLNATPVASFFYGQTEELPEAEQTIELNAQETSALAKDFSKERSRSFVEKSTIPALKMLAPLTKNLTKKVTFIIHSSKPEESVFVSIEKANEGFINVMGLFINSMGLHRFPVTRVTIYGTTPKASPAVVNLTKALVAQPSMSTGKIIACTGAGTAVIGGIFVATGAIDTPAFITRLTQRTLDAEDSEDEGEDDEFNRGLFSSTLAQELCNAHGTPYLHPEPEQAINPSHRYDATNTYRLKPNPRDEDYTGNFAILENALIAPKNFKREEQYRSFYETTHKTFVANALSRAFINSNTPKVVEKYFLIFSSDLEKNKNQQLLELQTAGWKFIIIQNTNDAPNLAQKGLNPALDHHCVFNLFDNSHHIKEEVAFAQEIATSLLRIAKVI